MYIRRKIMSDCRTNPRLQKAVAFALCVKSKLGRSSMLPNYTVNKLHTMTGMTATTIKKYLPILEKYGYVTFSGKNRQHLSISNLTSHHTNRNICIDDFCFDSFRVTFKSLRTYLVLIIQSHKDFVKRILQIAHFPRRGEDFRGARKKVRNLVKRGILNDVNERYHEYGLSYKRMAKEIGVCVRTAQDVIVYAIKKGWVAKKRIYRRFLSSCFLLDDCRFYKDGYSYMIYANRYVTNPSIAAALSAGTNSW